MEDIHFLNWSERDRVAELELMLGRGCCHANIYIMNNHSVFAMCHYFLFKSYPHPPSLLSYKLRANSLYFVSLSFPPSLPVFFLFFFTPFLPPFTQENIYILLFGNIENHKQKLQHPSNVFTPAPLHPRVDTRIKRRPTTLNTLGKVYPGASHILMCAKLYQLNHNRLLILGIAYLQYLTVLIWLLC